MKYLAAVLALASAGIDAAPPPNPHRVPALRQVVSDQDLARRAAPRQLSTAERAELRRQLSEHGRSAVRR